MVRLLLSATAVVCTSAAIAVDDILGTFVFGTAASSSVRVECRTSTFLSARVVTGVQSLVSADGSQISAWDTAEDGNGWKEIVGEEGTKVSLLALNRPSYSVEGGRIFTNTVWNADSVHWIRNRVIVPEGVTLTVEEGSVLKFGEKTGLTVEDGGVVKMAGTSAAPVVMTHFADDTVGGDDDFGTTNAVWNSWDVSVRDGGEFNDFYTQVRYGFVDSLPTLFMPSTIVVQRNSGRVKVPVTFDKAPEKRVMLYWRTIDGSAKYGIDFTRNEGQAVWVSGTTVYFEIPIKDREDVDDVTSFKIELFLIEGGNADPSRMSTSVTIVGGGIVPAATCAESESSRAIRLETRNPDPKPEPVPDSVALRCGRMDGSETWDDSVENLVLNTVVVPDGVTLTVVTNAMVRFTPNTGIKVEPGGKLNVIGCAEKPVLFSSQNGGRWTLQIVDGATFTDAYSAFHDVTVASHPAVSLPGGCEVSERNERVSIPVSVSGSRSTAFRAMWRAVNGSAKFGEDFTLAEGVIEWSGTGEGAKYITIPILNDGQEEDSETFIVEFYSSQGVNISAASRCTVLVRDGTAALVPIAACAESVDSEAIRIETREPDPKPAPVPALTEIFGGRLSADVLWDGSTTNFVLNTVVVPSGVTLTAVTNAYVKFAPHTGIKVEPGGLLKAVGSQDAPVVFDADRDGDYQITVVSGGKFIDEWAGLRNIGYSGFGTASVDKSLIVDASEGVIRIPVYITGSRTNTFSVVWQGSDGSSGALVWDRAASGTKYIELPIEGRLDGFSVSLIEGRGINISRTDCSIPVEVFSSGTPMAICAQSEASMAVRIENRAEGTIGRVLVAGKEWISADGETRAEEWNSATVQDGWQPNGVLVRNDAAYSMEGGRLQAVTNIWNSDLVHVVRNCVVVPSGAVLAIKAGTVVKFCEHTGFRIEPGGMLSVEGNESNPVVYTVAADDTIGGDFDLRESLIEDGTYSVDLVSGGVYSDVNCAVRYATFDNFGWASLPADAVAAETNGLVRIPLSVSTSRTTPFCVDWRVRDDVYSTGGRITWANGAEGIKYIQIPLTQGTVTDGCDAFTVELYESQGINISTSARNCRTLVYRNNKVPVAMTYETSSSDAIRIENRNYDANLEIAASEGVAIEGGRLDGDSVWSNDVVHLVRQWVVVPSGVTLTIMPGTVVKFLPFTGIKVEPGGCVDAIGNRGDNIVFTSVSDDSVGGDTDGKPAIPAEGNYSIDCVGSGLFNTKETQLRFGESDTLGKLSMIPVVIAKKDNGLVRIPVFVDVTSGVDFSVDWIALDGTAKLGEDYLLNQGRLDWTKSTSATKFIDIPLDRVSPSTADETFTVELTYTRGINLDFAKRVCTVRLYDTSDSFIGQTKGWAQSSWSESESVDSAVGVVPLFVAGDVPVRYSTRWTENGAKASVSVSDAEKNSTELHVGSSIEEGTLLWQSDSVEDGRYDFTHKIFDGEDAVLHQETVRLIVNRDVQIHQGDISENELWGADRIHLVMAEVTVKAGVTLTIAPDAIVKFMQGTGIIVENGGLGICKGAVLTHAYDDVMGGDTFFDGDQTVPVDGVYDLLGEWEDDETTQYRFSKPVEVSGTIKGENRWPGHKTYIVTGNLKLASGATLVIEAGAVVKFKSGLSLTVNSGATLDAQGTRSTPVVFTSIKDDEYGGDTNGDGDKTYPYAGDWDEIKNNGGVVNLAFASALYGGYGQYSNQGDAIIRTASGTTTMDCCVIMHSNLRLVGRTGGTVSAVNCILQDGRWGIDGAVTFINGVIADCNTGANGATVRNSILWECDTYASGGKISYCTLWGADGNRPQSIAFNETSGNIWGDPLFVDPETGDFRIESASLCVDAGDGTVAPERDYFGQMRQTIYADAAGVPTVGGKYPDIGIHEVMPRNVDVDVDMSVENIIVPEVLIVGETVDVSWTVKNIGSETSDGIRYDAVDLVCANGSIVRLGTVTADAAIPVGGSRIVSGRWVVPSAQVGSARIRVTVNANRDIFEGTLTSNNSIESGLVTLTMPELAFSDTGTASFNLPAGGSVGYKLGEGFADGGLLIVHAASATAGGVKVWTGNGQVPTADIFYASAVEVGGGDYLVRVPADGDAYVSFANGGSGLAKVEVGVETGAFLLFDTGVVIAPNEGVVSLTLYGNGFADDMEVWITNGRDGAQPSQVVVFDSVKAVATFDVTGLAAGAYEVHVKKGGVEDAASLLALTQQKVGPKWSCKLDIASALRSSREYVGYLEYSNSGDMPLDAPYVKITAGSGSFIRFGKSDAWGDTLELMATSETYPASQLKPGETRRIPFRYKTTGSSLSIECGYTQDDPSAFPWDTNAAYMRPSWASDELWGLSLAVLKSNVGATWNDYLARMRANCDHLAKIGQPTYRLDRIWQLEINEALGVDHAVSTLASNTDLARSGRGFGLALSRSYGSGLYRRLRKGIFGYGWSDNYSAYAELQNSGATLALYSGSGSTYLFEKVNGKWTPEDARDKTTCTESSSEYVLTYRSGTVQRIAKSNMRVSSVTDNQGNSLTFTYNADKQLVKVEHCDGQSLSFTYAGGLLASATDDQGRTTRYEYSGDLLVKVTAFNGLSTQYRYLPADGSVTSRALSQIRYADGTTRDYTYDGAGRVATVAINGNRQTVEIVRKALGSYIVVAPNGGETQVTLGASGEVRETVNALGQKSTRTYTADTLLESVVGPTGKRAKIAYDEDGQAVKATDAAGADTLFGYTSDFGNLAKVTDARGNSFDYGYDKLGRSKSISYADGSVESIAYNDRGDVTNSVNRRGQSIMFTYDNEGNKLSKVWENGRTFTWAYDAKGNCTNATDSATGTVTMEYDENERLTRIVHPKGRGFAYEYDSLGRTISRTTLGGTGSVPSAADIQRYTYDSLGRSWRMTDGDGNLYVENHYDETTGWLVTQTYGNGTVVSNAYDILGRTIGIYHGRAGTPCPPWLAFFEYAYDAEGRRISQTTAEGVERYTYDTIGQLTDVIYPDGTEEHFTYDAVGNRITSGRAASPLAAAVTTTYTANNLNQYTMISGGPTSVSAIEYDLDGNMTRKGDTRYYYDIQNRLVAVTNETADIAWSCEYDVFGNRTKVIDHGTAKETLFVQGSLPSAVADYDASGSPTTRHILLGSVRLADISNLQPSTTYYHADGLASTRLLTDVNGNAIATASYRAFGKVRIGRDALVASGISAGWVGTLGVERDDATGLIFMRNRYYDAEQGRFIQMDPIGIGSGDENLYRYCGGNSIDNVDPSGLVVAGLMCEAVVAETSAAGAEYVMISTVGGTAAGGATTATVAGGGTAAAGGAGAAAGGTAGTAAVGAGAFAVGFAGGTYLDGLQCGLRGKDSFYNDKPVVGSISRVGQGHGEWIRGKVENLWANANSSENEGKKVEKITHIGSGGDDDDYCKKHQNDPRVNKTLEYKTRCPGYID